MAQKKRNILVELIGDEIGVLHEFSKKYKFFTLSLLVFIVGTIFYFRPFFDEPIVITTNDKNSEWYQMAEGVAKYLKTKNVDVEIVLSSGTLDNVDKLLEPSGKVNAGYVIGPALSGEQAGKLYSLGSMDSEPMWIFYRKNLKVKIEDLKDLQKYQVGIGAHSSGSYVLTKKLLALHGVDVDKESNFISDKRSTNLKRLHDGDLDVLIMAGGIIDGTVQNLLRDPKIEVFNFKNAAAYEHAFDYYRVLKVPAGSLDLNSYLPSKDIDLIAVTSSLVVRKDMHPGEQLGLLLGAKDFAQSNNIRMYAKRDEYPAYVDPSIELSPVAKNFYESGPPSLLQYLPFKLAIFINRFWTAIVALAFLGSLQISFSLGSVNIKWKLMNELKELIELDRQLHHPNLTRPQWIRLRAREQEMYAYARALRVPLGAERDYMSLIESLDMYRDNLDRQDERLKEQGV